MEPLTQLWSHFERALIQRVTDTYRRRCIRTGQDYIEPSDESFVRPITASHYDVVLISDRQDFIAKYRVSLRGIGEIVRPVAEFEPCRKLRPETVLRLPRALVDRLRADCSQGQTVHEAATGLLAIALDERDRKQAAGVPGWRGPLRRIGLLR